ncbi:alpha-L-fucosidase [Foetidibacter luteolus]|uniref:alpha-L-fucosidase n=1 Tax=Foetidibacter luteolus TaxID=2608880 RepID=UPI00129B367D|nr:alpha-L-fucosidase [Foetidibacter luteolus]
MLTKHFAAFFFAAVFLCGNAGAQTFDRYQSNWESLKKYQVPDWFRDAKFGIFIHWGVYSVPAFRNEWYPRNMYQQGSDEYKHQLEKYGPLDKFGYKDFIPQFKAEKFNADEWAALFAKAGAKYVVPVAEHHDGFAMYKTTLSKWNAVEMGPKRDVIEELAAAFKKQNLVLGLSSHRIEHWFFMNGGRKFMSDVIDPAYADFYGPAREENETMTPEYMNDWLLRCTELVDKYQPQLVWFDWWIEQPALDAYKKSFASYYYNKGLEWNKGVVINYKNTGFPEGTAVLDIERGKLTGIRNMSWQTDDAVGFKSWGYIPDDNFKSSKYLITNLVDIVSKNGNLLLNIGPRPDGTIPQEEQDILLAVGKWLQVNGEAIYGTRPWKTFGEGPTEVIGGSFVDDKVKPFTAQDIRFTTKGDTLYAIALDIPSAPVTVKTLALKAGNGNVAGIELVGSTEKVSWQQKADGLVIQPLKQYPAESAVVYKITFKK